MEEIEKSLKGVSRNLRNTFHLTDDERNARSTAPDGDASYGAYRRACVAM